MAHLEIWCVYVCLQNDRTLKFDGTVTTSATLLIALSEVLPELLFFGHT
jgi:hypothetical protein